MGSNEEKQMDLRKITVRLDALISLMTENMVATGLISKSRAIELLYASGMSVTEIGRIFERPATDIGSTISRLKRQKRSSKKVTYE